MQPVFLCGMKHCGKSTLGRLIAQETNSRCYDLDDLILKKAGDTWTSVRELYKELGKGEFQRWEEEAARYFAEWVIPDSQNSRILFDGQKAAPVLALGGGTVENPGAMAWLRNRGIAVYLEADPELLYQRVMAKGHPPFLSRKDPWADFLRIHQRRAVLYSELADYTLPVNDESPGINAQRLLVLLRRHHAR